MRHTVAATSTRNRISRLLAVAVALVALYALPAFAGSDRFVETDEYKSKDFKVGILGDYGDLKEGGNIEWAWVSDGVALAEHKVLIDTIKDATDELSKPQLEAMKALFVDRMERVKGSKGALKAELNVYEVQEYSPGKAWIPFAGGHQMQAGMGFEMLLKDGNGKVVAKLRHFAREGIALETAAQEVADDMRKYIAKH